MICIVLGHLGNATINRVVFTFHVPIFFFITGYFIRENGSMKDFIKDKARKLLIPYACTCFAIIVLAIIKNKILFDGSALKSTALEWLYASIYGAGDNYQDPFYIKGIGAIWFLWATFWGSIFLRFSLKMKMKTRMAFIFILFWIGQWTRRFFWFPFSIQAGCCALFFMYLGFLLKEAGGRFRDSIRNQSIIYRVLFGSMASFYKGFPVVLACTL